MFTYKKVRLIVFLALTASLLLGCSLPIQELLDIGTQKESTGYDLDAEMSLPSDSFTSKSLGIPRLVAGLNVTARAFLSSTREKVGVDRTLAWDSATSRYRGSINVGEETGQVIVHIFATDSNGQIAAQGSATINVQSYIDESLTVSVSSSATYALRQTGPGGGWITYDKGSYSNSWRYLETAPNTWNGGTSDPTTSWGKRGVSVTTGSAYGDGASNTTSIANKMTEGDEVDTITLAAGGSSYGDNKTSTNTAVLRIDGGMGVSGTPAQFRVATTRDSGATKNIVATISPQIVATTGSWDTLKGSIYSAVNGAATSVVSGFTGTGCTVNITIKAVTGTAAQIVPKTTGTSFNGYNDWSLPSSSDLAEMYTNLKAQAVGNFTNGYYWSSSQADLYNVAVQNFNGGATDTTLGASSALNTKSLTNYSVRPVRYL